MTADMAQTISDGLRQYEQQLYSRRRTEQELQAKLPPGSLGRPNFFDPNARSLSVNGMYPLPPAPFNTPNVNAAHFPVSQNFLHHIDLLLITLVFVDK